MKLTRRQFAITATVAPSAVVATPMAAVTPQHSEAAIKTFFSKSQVQLASAPLLALVEATLAFYTQVPVAGLRVGQESDMLLFQWGVFDWGKGEYFEFDITRQFMLSQGSDDDAISQLRVTSYITPSKQLRDIPSGNRWCRNAKDVPDFQAFILSSAAFRLGGQQPRRVEVAWSPV